MVARTTPARRAISAMLASGSLASASTAASRIRATLRSASARRRRLLWTEAVRVGCFGGIGQWIGIDAGASRNFGRKLLAGGRTIKAIRLPTAARAAAARKASAIPLAPIGLDPFPVAAVAIETRTATPNEP